MLTGQIATATSFRLLLVLVATSVAAQDSTLPVALPDQLPDISNWEQSSGFVEIEAPKGRLDYRLYVDPERGGIYAVTYYRVRLDDPEKQRQSGVSGNAKLQWTFEARDVRRFECMRTPNAADDACRWQEHERGGAAYNLELATVLHIYSAHRDRLHALAEAAR